MTIYPDTVDFSHSDFTDEDLPAARQKLAMASANLEDALRVVLKSENPSIQLLRDKIHQARDMVDSLVRNLQHRM